MIKILFVDDEPLVLKALHRMLHTMHGEWNMRFAENGAAALQLMTDSPADVVISDMRMPQMNGAELLNRIMKQYPKTVRIILSGYADLELIMECVGGTHQFLSKPCDGATLKNIIRRSVEMDAWLNSEALKTLILQIGTLPSLPGLYFQILKQLTSPTETIDDVGATIARDPGMTARILQIVNSAFFGLGRPISNPTEAVLQLGLETIKSLVLGIHVFSNYEGGATGAIPLDPLWNHSLATAATARNIARLEHQDRLTTEACYTAGLLHDIGRLILLASLPDQYCQAIAKCKNEGVSLLEAEHAVFGANHAEVGGYLLGHWGLPISLVEAVVYHHSPDRCHSEGFTPLTAVHAANIFEHAPFGGLDLRSAPQLDQIYLQKIDLADRVSAWRDLAHDTPAHTNPL